MDESTAAHLLAINRRFYTEVARPFGRSRSEPQPGFSLVPRHLPDPCPRFLDVGCGEGRLGRFLLARAAIGDYTGVDFTPALLAQAASSLPGTFLKRDLTQSDALEGLGQFEGIACLATLQHIPSGAWRQRLLVAMAERLAPAGRLVISSWQFLESARQRRKILPWTEVGLEKTQVEPNDYLLAWRRGRFGRRYVRAIDLAELTALAEMAGLGVLTSFRADGREGNLNLYAVLSPVTGP